MFKYRFIRGTIDDIRRGIPYPNMQLRTIHSYTHPFGPRYSRILLQHEIDRLNSAILGTPEPPPLPNIRIIFDITDMKFITLYPP